MPAHVSDSKHTAEPSQPLASPGSTSTHPSRRQSQTSLSQNMTPSQTHQNASQTDEKHPPAAENRGTNTGTAAGAGHVTTPAFNAPSNSASSTPSLAGNSAAKAVAGPSVINKQLLSKLNKSLKEKQKITNANRETQAKNPTLIQNVLSTSPSFSAANSINPVNDHSGTLGPASNEEHLAKPDPSESDTMANTAQNQGKDPPGKAKMKKNKKIAKQNSTRTDFFAAKLASAVDDVESSDSDETFVYETNAHEFGADDQISHSAGSNVSPAVARDPKEPAPADNINHAPASIQLVHDNISVAGSIRNVAMESHANSPSGDKNDEKDLGSYVPSSLASRAESIHSVQSSKPNPRSSFHATPPTTTSGRSNLPGASECPAFSDPYLDTHARFSRPTRKSSSHSILSDDRKDTLLRSPHSSYGPKQHPGLNPVLNSYGLSENSQISNPRPYQEGLYAYGEEEGSVDEASSHGDVHSIGTDSNAHLPPVSGNKGESLAAGYKSRSNKPSTTSSKLRSTTSKLFDKKGAQPRRYSTIPDDIDIEDFDDELIYYDNNNIRFPYNNHSSVNESSSLLNGHKLPHHRSLNLNVGGKRAAAHPRNTRYVSLGYTPSGPYPNGNKKGDIFPFPYPDNHHNFYGFDEYDEESPDNDLGNKHVQGRSPISPSNTRFLLPRKVSQDAVGSERLRIFKNVIYTLVGIICILSVGFVSGFLLASTKDLANVSITSINHATVSQDELVFNVVIEALNPGWFTVSLEDLELDIFAKSGYLEEPHAGSSVETVLLGSVLNFETTLNFEGSFFNRQTTQRTGEIKLVGPGKNFTGSCLADTLTETKFQKCAGVPKEPKGTPDNSEKWAVISKHPFDLILRGVIKYNLPWTNNVKSVVVNKVGYIDPSQSF